MPIILNSLGNQDGSCQDSKEIFYADDGSGGGKLTGLKYWWDNLCTKGPLYGYNPKPSKTWLIVKPGYIDEAKRIFSDVHITDVGHEYLGSFIGTDQGKDTFVSEKIDKWILDIDELSTIANREPQLAYSAFIYGLSKRWNYICRTTPNVSALMKRLEFKIREKFIPSILDRAFSCTDFVRKIFALPCKLGGLSLTDISEVSDMEYAFSQSITKDLTEAVYQQHAFEYVENKTVLQKVKSEVSK